MNELNKLFSNLDSDNDGKIDQIQLKRLLNICSINIKTIRIESKLYTFEESISFLKSDTQNENLYDILKEKYDINTADHITKKLPANPSKEDIKKYFLKSFP
jgi:Ca2+-binding EF-hand superfamily protein